MKLLKLRYLIITALFISLSNYSCIDDPKIIDDFFLPTVSTTELSSIDSIAAISGGIVLDDGGTEIFERGVCWSIEPDPTVLEYKTSDGTGTGEFISNLTDLTPNTTYYVRAYATNSVGTGYGVSLTFTTLPYTLDLPEVPDNDHMLLGNPTNATAEVDNENNYLMLKSQYNLSYNNSTRTANWVSWHLYSGHLGDTPRQNDFRQDYALPSGWYRVGSSEFSGSGFDRGHLCPSADRTLTVQDNSATFLMTNMMPQAPNNNRITWAQLETYSRSLVNSGNELYIICGPHGQGGSGSNGYAETVGNGVVVPSKTWKIIVVLQNGDNDLSRITTSTRVISVVMPNDQTCNSNPWHHYRVSVDSLETLTGYDFLSNVPEHIQDIIESKVDNTPI